MILTSTTATDRYTPPWRKEPDAPVYLLRGGSVLERAAFEAALAGPHRAGMVFDYELDHAVREGVSLFMADEPALDTLNELLAREDDVEGRGLQAVRAGQTDEAKAIYAELSAAERQMLSDARAVLAEHYGPYRDLLAQQSRRLQIAPIEALRRFLVGLENVEVELTRDRDGMISEATLAALDPVEMMAVGNRAYSLLYAGSHRRPFAPPTPSAGDPPSSSPARSRAAGSSARKPGRKTPASS